MAGHTPTPVTRGWEGRNPATMTCQQHTYISSMMYCYCITYIRKQGYSIFNPVPPAFATHVSYWGNAFGPQ
jgi:hypothetical protein